ncbi:MAG: tetraacyldisaccharide 4'-kinase [bacterium]|nr:tetraacyldisaccharide 4'-kinase [bacterium]
MNIVSRSLIGVYHLVMKLRNSLYNRGFFRTVSVSIPVVSVGNLSFGGTGKTPMVIWISKQLQEAGFQPVIISRGYKRKSMLSKIVSDKEKVLVSRRTAGDEPFFMAKKLPGIPVIVSKNRLKGAAIAKKKFNPRVIVLDDGFQHRKIERNIDIVLIDTPDTLNKPAMLREPPDSLRRAHAVVFTKYDQFKNMDEFEKEMVKKLSCSIFRAKFKPDKIVNDRVSYDAEYLKGKTVWLVCGIGNPEYFRKTVEKCGAHVSKMYKYRDHASYPKFRVRKIMKKFVVSTADLLLTTEKDWYKFKKWIPADSVCYYLDIDMDIKRDMILRKYILDQTYLDQFEDLE